jgi:hypothetical protein
MAKKINIIQLTPRLGDVFTVGATMCPKGEIGEPLAVIERIIYEKHGYNKGKQGDFSAYVIFFEGNIRKIIPQSNTQSLVTEVIEEEEVQLEVVPELPE